MRTDIPLSQKFDAYEIESKGLRDLFKIELRDASNSVMYLTPHNELYYMDQSWEYLPCKLTDNAQNSTGEQSRPKFAAVNPNGLFSLWVGSGALEGAIVTRYRVLLTDIEKDVRAYTRNMWIVSKVISLNKDIITIELRSTLDGINFKLPARTFFPPDFPHVSLR